MKNQTPMLEAAGLLLLCLCLSTMNAAAGDFPESITLDRLQNLYSAVVFDHQTHSEIYSCDNCHHLKNGSSDQNHCHKCHAAEMETKVVSCSVCHLEKMAAFQEKKIPQQKLTTFYHIDIPTLKGAMHLQCAGCHREEGGPTGCLECHDFTDKGKKRFYVQMNH